MITFLVVVGFATGVYLGLRKKGQKVQQPRITH